MKNMIIVFKINSYNNSACFQEYLAGKAITLSWYLCPIVTAFRPYIIKPLNHNIMNRVNNRIYHNHSIIFETQV